MKVYSLDVNVNELTLVARSVGNKIYEKLRANPHVPANLIVAACAAHVQIEPGENEDGLITLNVTFPDLDDFGKETNDQ